MGRNGRLWLCVAPVALCFFDYGLTLLGQFPAYWEGDYTMAYEGNPVARWCLQQHPAVLIVEAVVWIVLFVTCVLLLPIALAKIVSIGVILGHIAGSSTWIEHEWVACIVFLSSGALIVWTWDRAAAAHEPDKTDE